MFEPQYLQALAQIVFIKDEEGISQSSDEAKIGPMLFAEFVLKAKEKLNNVIFYTLPLQTQQLPSPVPKQPCYNIVPTI